jgi:hypothetical protein
MRIEIKIRCIKNTKLKTQNDKIKTQPLDITEACENTALKGLEQGIFDTSDAKSCYSKILINIIPSYFHIIYIIFKTVQNVQCFS